MKSSTRGFTLVELSIVLVIIGLLVGGVLTGQSLIRAAELRSVTSQFQRYQAAVNTFRDKYFALPGDMTNATSYWGIAAGSTGNDATCAAAASTTTATCNGNGDGRVNSWTGSYELFRFWQHLANAGLIEGSYNGIPTSGVSGTSTLNAPSGRISGSLWYTTNNGTSGAITSSPNGFDGQYDNYLIFGGYIANNPPVALILKSEDAYNIDAKMDDGKPATGKIMAFQTTGWTGTASCTDATSSTTLTANYLLTYTSPACALYFRQAY